MVFVHYEKTVVQIDSTTIVTAGVQHLITLRSSCSRSSRFCGKSQATRSRRAQNLQQEIENITQNINYTIPLDAHYLATSQKLPMKSHVLYACPSPFSQLFLTFFSSLFLFKPKSRARRATFSRTESLRGPCQSPNKAVSHSPYFC